MAMLIRWQFDSCDSVPPEGFDKWWTDMHIDGQMQCERSLSFTGNGESCIVVGDKVKYRVDLVRMIQLNLETGRIRLVRRTITLDFRVEDHFFDRGRLKKRRPADLLAGPQHQKLRR